MSDALRDVDDACRIVFVGGDTVVKGCVLDVSEFLEIESCVTKAISESSDVFSVEVVHWFVEDPGNAVQVSEDLNKWSWVGVATWATIIIVAGVEE